LKLLTFSKKVYPSRLHS